MSHPVSPEIEALIADARLSVHLATSVDDRPHVAPVWYVYEDGTIWVLTGGKKRRNAARNPRVGLSIEHYDDAGVEWSVHLLGTAREVDDPVRIQAVQERMDAKYEGPYGTDGGELDDGWALIEITIGSDTHYSY